MIVVDMIDVLICDVVMLIVLDRDVVDGFLVLMG